MSNKLCTPKAGDLASREAPDRRWPVEGVGDSLPRTPKPQSAGRGRTRPVGGGAGLIARHILPCTFAVLLGTRQTRADRARKHAREAKGPVGGMVMAVGDAPASFRRDDTHPRCYSPATLPLMQSLLATLANIELEFEQNCEKARSIMDAQLRARVLERLKAKHQARREPYVRQISVLQKRAFGGALEVSAT
jgi:hypothetical protein